MADHDRDREHADILLQRKRAQQDYEKAVSDLGAAGERLADAYKFPAGLVVDDNGRLYNGRFGHVNSLTPPLPTDAEIIALVRRGVDLQKRIEALDKRLLDFD